MNWFSFSCLCTALREPPWAYNIFIGKKRAQGGHSAASMLWVTSQKIHSDLASWDHQRICGTWLLESDSNGDRAFINKHLSLGRLSSYWQQHPNGNPNLQNYSSSEPRWWPSLTRELDRAQVCLIQDPQAIWLFRLGAVLLLHGAEKLIVLPAS